MKIQEAYKTVKMIFYQRDKENKMTRNELNDMKGNHKQLGGQPLYDIYDIVHSSSVFMDTIS